MNRIQYLCENLLDYVQNATHFSVRVKWIRRCFKRKLTDDHLHFAHYLDVLRSFKLYVFKQNLISSTNHTVRTVHTRKVGLRAFETKRWLCEDTVHTHSHDHKDTVSGPMALFGKSSDILKSFVITGILSHNDLHGTSSLAEWV